jgi:hypothetical protein
MANIKVKVVKDVSNRDCLRIMDGDECKTNPIESGIALRRVIQRGDQVSWSNDDGVTLTITFPNGSPFTAALQPGTTVNATVSGNATQGRYKYTIATSTAQEDPQMVVDAGSISSMPTAKKKTTKKKTIKKK